MSKTSAHIHDIARIHTFADIAEQFTDTAAQPKTDTQKPEAAEQPQSKTVAPTPEPEKITKPQQRTRPLKKPPIANHKSARDFLQHSTQSATPKTATSTPEPETKPEYTPTAEPKKPPLAKIDTDKISDEVAALEYQGKKSILSDTVQDISDAEKGTIIADKKRKRFRLIPAIGVAMQDWFVEKKESLTPAEPEQTTIARAEDRIDTIAAAVTGGTQAPQTDFAAVAEQHKDTEAPEIISGIQIKEPEAVPAPRWHHVHEDQQAEEEQTVTGSAPTIPVRTPDEPEPEPEPEPGS